MDISFTTVVNTLFFSALATVLLRVLIDRTKIMSGKVFGFFTFIVVMIALRLFVPCEILGIQTNVYITRIYPKAYLFMTRPFVTTLGKDWSATSILLVISLLGSVVCAVRVFLSYGTIVRTLKTYPPTDEKVIEELAAQINGEWGKNQTFRIVQSREIAAPFLFGLRHPVIALPKNGLSAEEWYYILKHEMAHYYHRDLWVRFVCEALHIVYWWNPFVTLLRRQLIVFQERHTDAVVTEGLEEGKMLDYLSCLVKAARSQNVFRADNRIAEFSRRTEAQDRIKRLLDMQEKKPLGRKYAAVNILLTALLVAFTLFLPNLVTLEPDGGIPAEILENTFSLTPENAYLILNEAGKYEVYADGEYKATCTQIPEEALDVYNKEGELVKDKQISYGSNHMFRYRTAIH